MSNNETITIGIDSSTKCCGIAIYSNGTLKETSALVLDGNYDLVKLRRIVSAFESIISYNNPSIILIEEPAPVRNSKALTSLNQVAGAILAVSMQYCDTVDMVHNRTIKKEMGIKSKEDSIEKVKKLYNYKCKTHDEADACLVVETYMKLIEKGVLV